MAFSDAVALYASAIGRTLGLGTSAAKHGRDLLAMGFTIAFSPVNLLFVTIGVIVSIIYFVRG